MAERKKELKRTLGLVDIILFGIGGIVGAGIYAIIGEAAGLAGDWLWASFVVAALVAFFTGLCYAEFVSRFPDAGGSFEYVKQGLGTKPALFLSIIMFFTGVVAPAAIAISFGEYLSRLAAIPNWISMLSIIVLMAAVNFWGIEHSSRFNAIATTVTLLGLASVVVFAIPYWGERDLITNDAGVGWVDLLSGSAIIFFSYVGFEDLVKLAEETKEPKKNMPKGIVISSIAVLLIYVLIAVSALSVLSPEELSSSNGPLASVISTAAGPIWATGLVVVALFATSKTILSNILSSSRLLFDVARDHNIPIIRKFAALDDDSQTPYLAILFTAVMTMLFGAIGNLKVVASISNIFVFILFLSVNIALIRYRFIHQDEERPPFYMPLNIGRVSIFSILAVLGLLVLLGFNLYNIFG